MCRSLLVALLVAALAGCGGSSGVVADGGAVPDGGSCPNDLPAACPATMPSYARDIAPLLTRSCITCHSSGGSAPNAPLGDYEHLFSLRSAVLDQVYACEMPPRPAVLTGTDRGTLLAWLVCGAPNN